QPAQRLRCLKARRGTGDPEDRWPVSDLPDELGLWPARQKFSVDHAAARPRARAPFDRERPDRRAHDLSRSGPVHIRDRRRHPGKPVWRSEGLGWLVSHDVRGRYLLVWIRAGYLYACGTAWRESA